MSYENNETKIDFIKRMRERSNTANPGRNDSIHPLDLKWLVEIAEGSIELKEEIRQMTIWKDQERSLRKSLDVKLKEAVKGLDYYADEKMYEKDSDGEILLMGDCGPVFAQSILRSIRGESK